MINWKPHLIGDIIIHNISDDKNDTFSYDDTFSNINSRFKTQLSPDKSELSKEEPAQTPSSLGHDKSL